MKKFVIFIVVLAVLIGGGIFAVQKLVPMERIEAEAKSRFKAATGRDLEYADMRFSVWPNLGLRLRNVTVSNPSWAKEKDMLQLGELDVSLAAKPLLERKIEVKRFVLKQPVIHLEKAADGKISWALTGQAGDVARQDTSGEKKAAAPAGENYSYTLGEFRIEKGSVSFADDAAGTVTQADDVTINLVMPNLSSAASVDGGLTFRGKAVNLALSLDQPLDFLNGKPSKGNVNFKTDDFDLKSSGQFATAGTFLNGDLSANVTSLPGLVAWATGKPAGELPFKTVSVEGRGQATGSAFDFAQGKFKLDDISATGKLSVNYGGAKPSIVAKLATGKLDLDRFVSAGAGKDVSKAGADNPKAQGSGQAGWDATPIDLSALKSFNADLSLTTQGFSLKGADVGPSALAASLQNGNLVFKSSPATLFGGTFSSDLNVNASGATPTMAFKFNMAGVDAKPVLTTFADFDKLSGTADANVSVNGAGNNQRSIVSSLNGSGNVVFRNGSLKGIDIVDLAQAIQSKLGEMGVGGGKTDFVEMGGAFTIVQGVAHNENLALRGPLVQATGKGDIDLPRKTVNYRLLPVITASSGVANAKGLTVPVDIRGPFSDIKIKPDYASALKNALEHPEDIKASLKSAKENLAPAKENIKTLKQDLKKDPAKAIEGLLGGGLGGLLQAKPKAAPTAPQDSGAVAPADPATPAVTP